MNRAKGYIPSFVAATALALQGCQGVGNDARVAVADKPTPGRVTLAEVESYFERARPVLGSDEASRVRALLREQKRKRGFEFSETVECRGEICRASLKVPDVEAAERLRQMEVSKGSELLYQARIVDLKEVIVVVFSTTPGTRFSDLIGSGS